MRELARIQLEGGEAVAIQGDITALDVDVVVNAANEQLEHDGGVAAAIVRAGGPQIQEESDAWVREHGMVRTGRAAVTTAGAMPCRWVVHTVGPRYRAGHDNEKRLRAAVVAALEGAAEMGASSVALPAISAGIFGYPPDEATWVIADAVRRWLTFEGSLPEVYLVGFDDEMAERFATALRD